MSDQIKKLPNWFSNIYVEGEHTIDSNLVTISYTELSENQTQTKESFGYQWSRRDLFDQKNAQAQVSQWLIERFGNPAFVGEGKIILDAGCGGGQSAVAYFGDLLNKNFYIGNDVSSAVKVAKERFAEKQITNTVFIQSDLNSVPIKPDSVDVIFSEGVLHHTDNAKNSFQNIQKLLRKNGLFIFYVYKKKAPIREFTDDHIRDSLKNLSPEDKFNALLPLTKLGQALGDLNIIVNIENSIDFLGIPSGKIDIQRLFFYYMFKCFYKPDWTLEQMNLTNFDWYSPQNCSRHTKEEVRTWFNSNECGCIFEIEREYEDDSGLSYIVRKK